MGLNCYFAINAYIWIITISWGFGVGELVINSEKAKDIPSLEHYGMEKRKERD